LSELNVGEWGGLTSPEIEVRYPRMLEKWRLGRIVEFPGGESWQDFVDRVSKGITLAGQLANGNAILSIVHAGVLRAVNHILHEPLITYPNLGGRWLGTDGSKIISTAVDFP
jgi:broad specificity phosphatase PhoE